MGSPSSVTSLEDHSQSAIARARVERLLLHFRRFLAPNDEKILSLEERLAALLQDRHLAA